MLRRPLSRGELRALLGEAKCSVCMRTRLQLAKSGAAAPAAAAAAATNGGAVEAPAAPADATAAAAARPLPPKDLDATNGGELSRGGDGDVTKANGVVANGKATAATAAAVLSCCPHCHWGWACSEHRDAYLAGPHAAVCVSYQHMNESQLLTHRYLTATGRLPNYVPDKLPRPTGQSGALASWQPVPAGWAAFQAWRPLPAFDQAMMCLLTKRMSQALTVVQALQHHYTPQQLACRPSLEVHVLGASAFEVPADRIWEEILNLLPPYCPPESPQPPAPADTNGAPAANGTAAANGASAANGTAAANDAPAANGTAAATGASAANGTAAATGASATNGTAAANGASAANGTATAAANGASVANGTAAAANSTASGNGTAAAKGAATAVENGNGNGASSASSSSSPSSPSPSRPRVLHVAFVGPELQDIIVEESDGRALPQGTALSVPPPPPGRELLYSYHLCAYQDFAAGRKGECPWRRPDIAVAFNSGISEFDQETWAPALEVLVRHGVPVVFTSYNGEEAAADAAAWRAAGGEVTLGPERNPFRALEPIAEPSQVDSFYYQNYYWWCGRASDKKQQRQQRPQ